MDWKAWLPILFIHCIHSSNYDLCLLSVCEFETDMYSECVCMWAKSSSLIPSYNVQYLQQRTHRNRHIMVDSVRLYLRGNSGFEHTIWILMILFWFDLILVDAQKYQSFVVPTLWRKIYRKSLKNWIPLSILVTQQGIKKLKLIKSNSFHISILKFYGKLHVHVFPILYKPSMW